MDVPQDCWGCRWEEKYWSKQACLKPHQNGEVLNRTITCSSRLTEEFPIPMEESSVIPSVVSIKSWKMKEVKSTLKNRDCYHEAKTIIWLQEPSGQVVSRALLFEMQIKNNIDQQRLSWPSVRRSMIRKTSCTPLPNCFPDGATLWFSLCCSFPV